MSYSDSHIRLTFGGQVSSEDVWSNGLALAVNTAGMAPTAFAALEPEDFDAAIRAAYIGSGGIASYNNLTYIKLALIGTDGKYLEDAKIYDYPAPVTGTINYAMPPQDSVVVSLLTAAKRGLANRGRIYLPSGFADVGNNGKVTTANQTSIANRFVTFINAVNGVGTSTGANTVASIVSGVGAGAIRNITSIEVGNLMDSQRRRRNRLTETYVAADLTP